MSKKVSYLSAFANDDYVRRAVLHSLGLQLLQNTIRYLSQRPQSTLLATSHTPLEPDGLIMEACEILDSFQENLKAKFFHR